MDRTILYRGKRNEDGEWVEGLPSYNISGDIREIEVHRGYCSCDIYEVSPETVGQYTGKNDTYGRKIFEGDICIIRSGSIDEEDGGFTVKWDQNTARYILSGETLVVDFDNICGHECEVISNIFRDPELTEKQIPKKPILDTIYRQQYHCPNCEDFLAGKNGDKPHHCKCGQAIDWDD